MKRRDFLRGTAMAAVGLLATSCAQPTPQVIEKEVPVEKIVKETVIVEKQVPVEKIVKETVIVEKQIPVEKVVTATPIPRKYQEAPMLAELVKAGKLPPVEERLPLNPLVIEVVEEIGQYGGTWRRAYTGVSDRWGPEKINHDYLLGWRMPQGGTITIVPHVAEKFEQNADATSFTWYLRKGMKWSDGHPLTTADAKFWYEDLYMDPQLGAASYGGNVGGGSALVVNGQRMKIEVVDDYTFTTSFAGPNPLLPLRVCTGTGCHTGPRGPNFLSPAHYMKQFHPKYAKKEDIDAAIKKYNVATWDLLLTNQQIPNFWFQNPEVPVVMAWKTTVPPPAQRFVMERNPYYFAVDPKGNQLPYIDRVTHDLFENPQVLTMKLIAGEIDCQNRHVNPADFTVLKENEKKGDYRIIQWIEASTYSYHLNLAYEKDPVLRDIFLDVRFRQALSVAIDRHKINDLVYDGTMEVRQACPVSGSPQFDPEWETYYIQYDPALANKLLDEMGLDKRGPDGFRLRPDGQTLTVVLEYALVSFAMPDDVHQMVKEMWEAVGIKTLVTSVERTLYEQHEQANEVQIGSWVKDRSAVVLADVGWYNGSSPGGRDELWLQTGGKEGVKPPEKSPVPKIWELWEKIKVEPDEKKRNAMIKEVMDLNKVNLLSIGVVGEAPALFVTKNNFRNVPSGLVQDDPLRGEGLGMPQQYFFKQ